MNILVLILSLVVVSYKTKASIPLSCDTEWSQVLQTDSTGNVETGSKLELIKAVAHGAELQIFIPSWGYASGTTQIDIINNGSELCAGAIFHISKDSWESFHQDAYWYFLDICTSGYIDKARWYVGAHTQPSSVDTSSQTISRERIIWFVRHQNPDPVYCNSGTGARTCGNIAHFADLVRKAADFRLSYQTSMTPFNHLQISHGDTLISGQYLWAISVATENDHSVFQNDVYWWFAIWSTSGLLDMSRWNVGSHTSRSHTSANCPMTWYADICWMLAYEHDDKGVTLDGSLNFLKSALMDGHRVKLVMGNYSIEADNLVVKSNSISAQLLGHVSHNGPDHFSNNSYWYWNHVTTSGEGETIRYYVGSTSNGTSSNYTTSAKWFIDTRHWKHALSTSADGIATFGSKTNLIQYIRKGSKLRCVVHFSPDHIMVAQADNIEISPDGNNIGAQILRVISYTVEETSGRHFENVPYWKFTIVTTKGDIRQSDWLVGDHTTRETDPISADVEWYVD